MASVFLQPKTGLVYFSAIETSTAFKSAATFVAHPMGANTGLEFPLPPTMYDDLKSKAPRKSESRLVAWDPVKQQEAWRSGVLGTIGGGTLSTAGGLVFQGTNVGRFVAYDARDGKELWSIEAQTGVVAAPASFELDGEQYIAEEVGYGLAPYGASNQSRLLVFKLGGKRCTAPRAASSAKARVESTALDGVGADDRDGASTVHESLRDVPRAVRGKPLRFPGPALFSRTQ